MKRPKRTFRAAFRSLGLLGFLVSCSCLAQDSAPAATNLADRICRGYEEGISSVSCGIRRVGGPAGAVSRVYYKRPDRVHVENITPSKRRIVADGERLYYHEEGTRRGYSKAVKDLSGDWLLSLRNIPGTPMRNILDLRALPEGELEATKDFPVRRQYTTPQARVVLSCDAGERLLRLEFYRPTQQDTLMARYDYEDYREVAPGCWMPLVHRTLVRLPDGQEFKETTRIETLTVNKPVSERLFAHENFFPNVEFTDDFQKTYEP